MLTLESGTALTAGFALAAPAVELPAGPAVAGVAELAFVVADVPEAPGFVPGLPVYRFTFPTVDQLSFFVLFSAER